MLLQIKNKKGISAIIGYVLLVTFAVAMGGIVYSWMKSYVPPDGLECPDDVALLVSEVNCTIFPSNYTLNLRLKNNGLFDVSGYFIHATNDSSQNLATIDLSHNITNKETNPGSNAVLFVLGTANSLVPGEQDRHFYNITEDITSIEIIPVRWQEQDNRLRFVSCGKAKIVEEITCRE